MSSDSVEIARLRAELAARDARIAELEAALDAGAGDTDERQRRAALLEESQARLRLLINAMPDIVCFKDGEGRWLEANAFDLELFELQGVDYQGKTDAELAPYSPFYRDAFLACEDSDEAAWRARTLTRVEEAIPRPDGTISRFDVIKVPRFNPDGSRLGLIVIGRDITQRRVLEREIRRVAKMETVERMASGLAHEFNNLLMVVLAQANLLQMTLDQRSDEYEATDAIVEAAQQASKLTRQLLHFSREQSAAPPSPIELREMVADAARLGRGLLPKRIRFQVENASEDLWVEGHDDQLVQVIFNLLLNARDAIDGQGTVTLGLHAAPATSARDAWMDPSARRAGRVVSIVVRDDGRGMDDHVRERIFDPFFTTRAHDGGTGMGLAVVDNVIAAHRGEITVQSQPGEGTEFVIKLPVLDGVSRFL